MIWRRTHSPADELLHVLGIAHRWLDQHPDDYPPRPARPLYEFAAAPAQGDERAAGG